MKNRIKKDSDKKEPTKTSMSNASKPICHEAECIGNPMYPMGDYKNERN